MPEEPPRTKDHITPIIAIGASAGGLEACSTLLRVLPADMPFAFVVILHLDPSHDSMMAELLARDTRVKVVQATDGMALRPAHLYVIPPGEFLTVRDGILHTNPPDIGVSVRQPFDAFLKSLAQDAPSPPGCIVLSGTGLDGADGLGAIRSAGGLILAQDPAEASHSGMPERAIETGLVDHVLSIRDMPAVLAQLSTDAPPRPGDKAPTAGSKPVAGQARADGAFDEILALVAKTAPQDIALYRTGTIQRRISHRMEIVGVAPSQADRYLSMLRSDPKELATLQADILIQVTQFFRDPEVFAHLSESTLPAMIANHPTDRKLRVWVAGCGTGEEAYSLAMVCLKALEDAGAQVGLQLFASDIDADAIATARQGFYPKAIEKSVTPERLARFFSAEGSGWRVRSELRDVIVFTVADLLSDPPFSRIDLLSCRNVLIHLESEAQRRVIALCQFALRQDGLLLLGADETLGEADAGFVHVEKDVPLWRRIGQGRAEDLHFAPDTRIGKAHGALPLANQRTTLANMCRQIILENYAPAAVLLNDQFECLYLLGPTERYLRVGKGHPEPGFLGMLPRPLRGRVRKAAAACDASNPLIVVPGGNSTSEGRFNIELRAITSGKEQYLLACFVPDARAYAHTPIEEEKEGDPAARIEQLEGELAATREDLRHALHDLEHEVEAHASDSAEALSVNEEFQSTNEELLASKEELQALNEELTALNNQLQETLERHRTTADDLQNVLYSTDLATLFLDKDLNIRFFTPAARAVFNVIATDIGRPLTDLAGLASDENLYADARSVLQTSDPVEREVSGPKHVWYQRRIQPYRTGGGEVGGVVITFIDITERKRTHAALVAAKQEADRATIAKSRFLAAASHDLRQPLQSLTLLQATMEREGENGNTQKIATQMSHTLQLMTEMLDTLLDVTRIESGVLQANMQPVAIGPLIARVGEEFRPHCSLKGLKLRVVPCKAWVRTDPHLLERILRNLLSNAVKYTAKGGVLMGCRIKGDHLTIQVCDSGMGVPESEQTAIFEAYYQIDPSVDQGLGLGLSIVQRFASLLQHSVALRSTPGRGSVFMLRLEVVALEQVTQGDTPPPIAKDDKQSGTILLVEADDNLRQLLHELLESEGHTVISVTDGSEAVDWATEARELPDLLLADQTLPGSMTGRSLAQHLPDVLGFNVPTIILTGDMTPTTTQETAATQFVQITKPVSADALLDRVDALLHDAATRRVWTPSGPAMQENMVLHVVDDDPMVRDTTRRLFETEGWSVATHPSAEAFLAAPRPSSGACLVVDAVLPGISGLDLLRKLQGENSTLPAIMLTGHGDISMAISAMKAGAADMIEKPASASDLMASVLNAIERSADLRTRSGARRAAQKAFSDLTPRERDVLAKVLEGAPNKIIAANLGINQRTVENHRAAVMRKTGATSLPELVRLALSAGFPDDA